MAKFRNVDKRRSRLTGRKKTFPTTGSFLARDSVMALLAGGVDEYFDAHPMTTEESDLALLAVSANEADVGLGDPGAFSPSQPLMAGDGWIRLFHRLLSRLRQLRQWFQRFWSAARFTHPAGWLLEGQNRTKPG